MQPVAKLAFLDVANKAVNPGDRLGHRRICRQAKISLDARGLRFGTHGTDQTIPACGIKAVGSGIFIQQPFQSQKSLRYRRLGHRRRHMAQRYRSNAPFGLGRLAGIIDDKGINHRSWAKQHLGPTRIRQGHRFAGQPFQRAMRADMQQCMGVLRPQPQIERHIAMTRSARQIVVIAIARHHIAAFGLQGDQGVPRADSGKMERSNTTSWIIGGVTPCRQQIGAQGVWNGLQRGQIVGQRPCQTITHQSLPKFGGRRHRISSGCQMPQHRRH